VALLFIWLRENNNVGHCSMQLDVPILNEANTYISWWPDTSASPFKPSSPSFDAMSYAADVRAEGRVPHHTLAIPQLDDVVMQSWWARVKIDGNATPYRPTHWPQTPNYDLYDTNCANIVALAMCLGGAEQYAVRPRPLVVLTPSDMLEWGRRILASAAGEGVGPALGDAGVPR